MVWGLGVGSGGERGFTFIYLRGADASSFYEEDVKARVDDEKHRRDKQGLSPHYIPRRADRV